MKRIAFVLTGSILFFLIWAAPLSAGGADPNWGPNVLVFDPQMPMERIQESIDTIYNRQARNEFGSERFAFFFRSGRYQLDVKVGYYTHVIGLGRKPGDVVIVGAVRSKSTRGGHVLTNFWRACENLTVIPTTEPNNVWAVSQAAPLRRMHIKGSLHLHDGGYSSGGFIADSVIEGQIVSGTQQQWFTRNSRLGRWKGGNWNMMFVGTDNPPSGAWPDFPYTVINQTPRIREKPYLFLDSDGSWKVFVPALRENSSGITWAGEEPGRSVPLNRFYVARPQSGNAALINSALQRGQNVIFTPGVYHLDGPIQVLRSDTVLLGLGIATLIPDKCTAAIEMADAGGIILAGLLLDASPAGSPVLLQVGPPDAGADHCANPSSLHDIFCRVGGTGPAVANCSVIINSGHVIGDHFWLWRADHGRGVGWDINRTENGLIVNGDKVVLYGLFVEHYHKYQTLWNGQGGRLFFYQSEMPYDPPSSEAWRNRSGAVGWASYKVADDVTDHQAWGLGVYCVFKEAPIVAENAIEAPVAPGVQLRHLVAIRLNGQPGSGIRSILSGKGDSVIYTRKAILD